MAGSSRPSGVEAEIVRGVEVVDDDRPAHALRVEMEVEERERRRVRVGAGGEQQHRDRDGPNPAAHDRGSTTRVVAQTQARQTTVVSTTSLGQ